MSLKHREDSITGIRLREAQKTKIATGATLVDGSIVVELPEGGVCDFTMVKFVVPCDCEEVTGGIKINGETYTVVDASGECITGVGGAWLSGATISILIDQQQHNAYVLNANTNSYLEERLRNITVEQIKGILPLEKGGTGLSVHTLTELGDALGVARIATGSYTGNGNKSLTLTFPFVPKFVYCENISTSGIDAWDWVNGNSYIRRDKTSTSGIGTTYSGNASVSDKSLTINHNTAANIPNTSSEKYRWVAFG